jgi:hypothetical protein
MAATAAATKTKTKKPNKAKTKKPNKAKTRKPNKTKASKPSKVKANKPMTGQSGPRVEVDVSSLNGKEIRVLKMLNGKGKGAREILKITDLMNSMPTKTPKAQKNSWVRNSLRRLVTGAYVEKIERGSYRITDSGRRRMRSVK